MAQPALNSKSKTIKPPGSSTVRVSVACDRCRKKKIRCFYDDNDNDNDHDHDHSGNIQCANCKAVGLECIFTDKLARKAFPRGYTESLEERVRELEYENKKLQKLISLKSQDSDNDNVRKSVPLSNNSSGLSDNSLKSENNTRNKLGELNNNVDNNHDLHDNIRNNSMDLENNNSGGLNQHQLNSLNNNNLLDPQLLRNPNLRNTASFQLHTANVSRMDIQARSLDLHQHDENCNCGMDHSVINRPVSIAGSVDIDRGDLSDDESLYGGDGNASTQNSIFHSNSPDNSPLNDNISSDNLINHDHPTNPLSKTKKDDLKDENHKNRFVYNPNSFEQVNAPGAAAAVSLQNKLRTKNFLNLANLIAASIPRSTEETLFIPTLLARIIKTHGFDSKAPYLTARSIALLKQAHNENESTWNTIIPILNKDIFMSNYKKFKKSREADYEDGEMVGFEKFGELLVIITCLVMISTERANVAFKINNNNTKGSENTNDNNGENNINNDESIKSGNYEILHFYDHIIKQSIKSNMSSIGSISSLQIITIELLYCLATEDLTTSYSLRGRMITMSQQLRLHRCPAAVLGSNGSSVSKLQQGERRILFWCIYTLDSFSAFILGVPRLLKDYEIECALPSSASSSSSDSPNDTSFITFKNNVQLSLVGKVSDSALSVMRYSKILGTIVDSIFKRNDNTKQTNLSESKCLILEDLLDSWRINLPEKISIDKVYNSKDLSLIDNLTETQLTLYYLYYQAKALIYMPLLANESSNDSKSSKFSPAFISIQKASTSILTTMKVLNSSKHNYYFLPLPINISRQTARFALLAAKNSLEYTRGGSLFQEAKLLLNSVVYELQIQNKIGLLGCLSDSCILCLDNAIEAILSQPKSSSVNSNGNGGTVRAVGRSEITSPLNDTGKSKLSNEFTNADNKRLSNGSPLRNVSQSEEEMRVKIEDENSNTNNTMKRERDDGEMMDVDNERAVAGKTEIAINDIFSNNNNNSNKNFAQMQAMNNEPWKNSLNMGKNIVKGEFNGNNVETDIFKFMSEDPKETEEESLNMILKSDNSLKEDGEVNIERQKLLIEKKQQFLQAQQESLQKQIQMLKAQANVNESGTLFANAQLPSRTQSQPVSNMNTNMNMNMNVNVRYGNDTNAVTSVPSIGNLESLNAYNLNSMLGLNELDFGNGGGNTGSDVYNNKQSFSDLLMMNDFGVDASLGMPLVDFEFDNSSATASKRQKTVSNNGDYDAVSGPEGADPRREPSPSLFSWN